ncbi:MAG: hypothetical protein WAO35_27340 [Terriglobia bacterium]
MRSNKRAITLLLAMGLCSVPSSELAAAPAAASPAAPALPVVAAPTVARRPASVHKFINGPNVLMLGVSAAMMAADLATTKQALQVPGTRELNPLAQSPASSYALKFAGFGAGLAASYMMHRAGHYKAERTILMLIGGPSAIAAAHNAGIHR